MPSGFFMKTTLTSLYWHFGHWTTFVKEVLTVHSYEQLVRKRSILLFGIMNVPYLCSSRGPRPSA